MKISSIIARNPAGPVALMNVRLEVGDVVTYRLEGGSTVKVEITGPYALHTDGVYGWDGRFEDDGQIGFVEDTKIIDWPQKAFERE